MSQIPVFFLCGRGRPHSDSGLINSAVFQEKRIKSPIVKFVQLYIQMQIYGGNRAISKNKCSLFVRFSALFISHCKDTTSAISASGYGGLRPVSQGQMRINSSGGQFPSTQINLCHFRIVLERQTNVALAECLHFERRSNFEENNA